MQVTYDGAAVIEVEDGSYTISVDMEGGSGKASIQSPCALTVEDGQGIATLEWSSSHYDYMIVNGEKLLPVNEDGNSVFEVPVYTYDGPMEVIGDTTAMSTPHEIEYTLTFHSDTIQPAAGSASGGGNTFLFAGVGIVIVAALLAVALKKRGKKEEEK